MIAGALLVATLAMLSQSPASAHSYRYYGGGLLNDGYCAVDFMVYSENHKIYLQVGNETSSRPVPGCKLIDGDIISYTNATGHKDNTYCSWGRYPRLCRSDNNVQNWTKFTVRVRALDYERETWQYAYRTYTFNGG